MRGCLAHRHRLVSGNFVTIRRQPNRRKCRRLRQIIDAAVINNPSLRAAVRLGVQRDYFLTNPCPDELEVARFWVIGECRVIAARAGAINDLQSSAQFVGRGGDDALEVRRIEHA